MSDIGIKSINAAVEAYGKNGIKPEAKGDGKSFDTVINDALGKVSQVQNNVDKAVSELANGGDITSAVLAVEKADMTFQLMVEVRNKLLSTYQEIMKMPV